MFRKKKKVDTTHDNKIILGMIMLKDNVGFSVDDFAKDFKGNYGDKIQEPAGDNLTYVFLVDEETVAISYMSVPIPSGDIEETSQYAYNWQTALEDTKEHKSHLIVSIMQGKKNQIERFKIFTQVMCSLLRTTNSIGVYEGNQSLLIPTDDYISEAKKMNDESLPINLWIYFGLRTTENGNSGYTYGLTEFDKTEMEILNSSKSLQDIRAFLYNIAHYVLDYNVNFKSGQTCGLSEDEKILITQSKGNFLKGDTFKLAY